MMTNELFGGLWLDYVRQWDIISICGMMLQGAKLLGIREFDGSRQAFSYNIYNVYVSHLTISDQVKDYISTG